MCTSATAETLDRKVKANAPAAVGGFFAYEMDTCYRRPIPDVKMRRAPANGTVSIQLHETTLGKDTTCPGHRVKGPIYVYMPRKGFKGVDEFTVDVPFARSDTGVETLLSYTYRITVE
jgi:hypothetical protein